jgi:hypothetical protein
MFLTLYSLHLLCSPTFISSSSTRSSLCIPAYVLCMSCVCPVYVRRAPDVQSFLSSSVKSYLRSYLTADYRTSLVPAILHFFIHFYYFHLQMFERFMNCIVSFHMVCRLRYTPSACIRRAPDVQSFLSSSVKSYLRSNLTADYRTSPVPAILHFLSIFITFIYRCSRDL